MFVIEWLPGQIIFIVYVLFVLIYLKMPCLKVLKALIFHYNQSTFEVLL